MTRTSGELESLSGPLTESSPIWTALGLAHEPPLTVPLLLWYVVSIGLASLATQPPHIPDVTGASVAGASLRLPAEAWRDEMPERQVLRPPHRDGPVGGNGANLAVPVLIQVGLGLGLPVPAPPRMAAWGQVLT